MKDIKVTYKPMYKDMKPRETLVNGAEPNPILKDREGKEYFEAIKDMVLTVSEDRAKYLVEDRKLCEYVDGIVNGDELKFNHNEGDKPIARVVDTKVNKDGDLVITLEKDNNDEDKEEGKLVKDMNDKEVITLNANDIENITGANEIPEGANVVDGVVITEDDKESRIAEILESLKNDMDEEVRQTYHAELKELGYEFDTIQDDEKENKVNDNNDDDDKEIKKENGKDLETANKKINNLETADKKINNKNNKKENK